LIKSLPKISIIQAAGANPLVRTMRENGGSELVRVNAETRATAIRIGNPASWRKAVSVLKNTGGACEDVSESEIAQAKAELGAEGIGCEPASAATLAGLKKLITAGFVKSAETVVLVLTGHMLKDVDYMKQAPPPQRAQDRHALGAPAPGQSLLGPMEGDSDTVIKTLEQIYARH
jgi:threonine synthase